MTRRSRTEVIIDILDGAQSGANKTRIMYRCNLNFLCFNQYLSELLEKNLLKAENNGDGRLMYKTTEDGKALLDMLRKAQKVMGV